jgi:hypothetical protein
VCYYLGRIGLSRTEEEEKRGPLLGSEGGAGRVFESRRQSTEGVWIWVMEVEKDIAKV